VLAVGTILLVAGFGDGIGYSLATLTGQRSPWIFLLPVLLVALSCYLIARGPTALRSVDRLLVVSFGVFSVVLLVAQFLLVGYFDLAGLPQLVIFVFVAILVGAVFAGAPAWLNAAFRRSLVMVHYFLCGYIVLSYLLWHFLGFDPSIRVVLATTGARVLEDYYGFRPSGFSAEPAWAAIALAASYTGIHYLAPQHRRNGFIALLLATAALQSATAYLFVAVVVMLYAFEHLRTAPRRAVLTAGLMLTAGVVAGVLELQADVVDSPVERVSNIVEGRDASTGMRLKSAEVAWRVMEQSFPLGVGYGNFRKYAVYPSGFSAYARVEGIEYYKSDVSTLNYLAELGIFGAVLVLGVGGILMRTRHALAITFFAMIATLSGTLLLPPVLAMAAVVGLLTRDADSQLQPALGAAARQPSRVIALQRNA
jgi:hypothetical protein